MPSFVVAKLTYAASSWWGFTTAEDSQRLEAVIRADIRSGVCALSHKSVEYLVTDADDKRTPATRWKARGRLSIRRK